MARAVIVAVVSGYILNTLLSVIAGGLHGAPLAGFVVCLAVAFGLQLAHSTRAPLSWPVLLRVTTLSVQVLATLLPFLWVGPQAGALAGFLGGSVLLAVAGPWRWWLFGATITGVLVLLAGEGLAPVDIAYSVYFSLLTGLMTYGVSSLGSLVGLVHSVRDEMAWMAVARERLRVARDLHDLLGFNVSAMMLKSELAYRLLPGSVDRARQELRDVLQVAHRALADVRIVAGGDRRMSLAIEIEHARAMLTAAEMRVDLEVSLPALVEDLDTVLAIVVREAATNVLRHSKAEHCRIEAVVRDGIVRLLVRNDGVDAARPAGSGSGLDNLAGRLAAVGGRLTAGAEGQEYRLTADAPLLPAGATGSAAADLPPVEGAADAEAAVRPWHRRVARTITLLVLSGYGLLVIVNVLPEEPGGPGLLGFAACVMVLVGIQVVHSLREPRRWPARLRAVTLTVQAAASALPLLWIGEAWGSMGGFLAGSVLLVLGGPLRWVLFGAVTTTVLLVSLNLSHDLEWTGYLTLSTVLTGLVVYGISSLSGLVREVDRARTELARGAVTRERLRVARELQGQLGELLTAMTVKGESVVRLLPAAPEPARAEVAEMLDIARVAVSHIRMVATGYRHMSFTAELDLAASALAAAGVEADLRVPPGGVPGPVDPLLALVLREAVTAVIRHSGARSCTVTVTTGEGAVRLQLTNDGVNSAAGAGTAFEDLADRLRAVGGTLSTAAEDGTFRLTADLPVAVPAGLTGRAER